jgi:hypothetical protein
MRSGDAVDEDGFAIQHVAADHAGLVSDGNVHLRQRHRQVALLHERRAGVHVDERHLVHAARPEAGAQQWYADAIGAGHRLCCFTSHFHGHHRGPFGKSDFEERLRAILDAKGDLGERTPLAGDQRARCRRIGNRRQHACIVEPADLESEPADYGVALIAMRRQHRQSCQCLQRGVQLADVHPLDAVAFPRGQVEGSDAFDRHLASFALHLWNGNQPGIERERSGRMRPLQGQHDLMAARRRLAQLQHDAIVSTRARVDRAAGNARQLVARRQADEQRAHLTLHHGHVEDGGHPQVGVADREKGHDIGDRAQLPCRGNGSAVAHRP